MTEQSPHTLEVAQQAFTHFTHGLATGEWQNFLDMLTEDFTFWFPVKPFHGLNRGKARMREFLNIQLSRTKENNTVLSFVSSPQTLTKDK